MLSAVVSTALATAALPLIGSPAAAAGALHAVDLGTLPGTCCSLAFDINDYGTIVGHSGGHANTDPLRAFRWKDGVMIDLGTLGGPSAQALAIGDNGWIVGQSLLHDGVTWRAFLWRQGQGMIDLGTLGGNSMASDVNSSGQVVGQYLDAEGEVRGFMWTQSLGMVPLSNPPAGQYDAVDPVAISTWREIAATSSNQVARIDDQGVTHLSGLLGSSANGINTQGDIVGSYDSPSSTSVFVWQANGAVRTLQIPAGSLYGFGFDINDDGDVVGSRTQTDGTVRAVYWSETGVPHTLPSLATGAQADAWGINKYGVAVGRSQVTPGGHYHAVLWTR